MLNVLYRQFGKKGSKRVQLLLFQYYRATFWVQNEESKALIKYSAMQNYVKAWDTRITFHFLGLDDNFLGLFLWHKKHFSTGKISHNSISLWFFNLKVSWTSSVEGRESIILLNSYCAALFTAAPCLQLFLSLKYF